MGIVYPGAIDSFSVPSLPEETSLSAAGKNNNRNHTQLHDDINKAVVALETNAVLTSHDHSGTDSRTGGVKLIQGNTHEDADTDSSALAIHHTLGYGAYQAAPCNHTHSVATVSQNYQVCTSVSRPTPWLGMMIFETDTNQLKIWAQVSGDSSPTWHTLFGATAAAPPDVAVACRLRQGVKQKLDATGSFIEWHEELEDTLSFFNPANSLTGILVNRAGLYQIDCAIQWDPEFVPDQVYAVLCINGVETTVQQRAFIKGNLFVPGFSQTLSLSGKLRFTVGNDGEAQALSVKVSYTAGNNLIDKIFSFFDPASSITSRIDVVRVGS